MTYEKKLKYPRCANKRYSTRDEAYVKAKRQAISRGNFDACYCADCGGWHVKKIRSPDAPYMATRVGHEL